MTAEVAASTALDLVLSCAREDQKLAVQLQGALDATGYHASLQILEAGPGFDLYRALHPPGWPSLPNVIIISLSLIRAGFSRRDWISATVDGSRRVIPVIVDAIEPDYYLGPYECINFRPTFKSFEIKQVAEEIVSAAGLSSVRTESISTILNRRRSPHGVLVEVPIAIDNEGPSLRSIPQGRGQVFTGRDELLERLSKVLGRGGEIVAGGLVGERGVGKSTLALEYARRHMEEYDVVWWIRGTAPSQISEDVSRLGLTLGLVTKRDQWPVAEEKVRKWCEETDKRWLLIFDDVDDPEQLVATLPRRGSGHVLITSRREAPSQLNIRQINVDVLPEDSATRYLLQRTGSSDERSARFVARAVNGLALALELAGAYIKAAGLPISEYVRLLQAESRTLALSQSPGRFTDWLHVLLRRRRTDVNVRAVGALSIRAVESEDFNAMGLLRILSQMDIHPVSGAMLEGLGYPRAEWRTCVGLLSRLSLIECGVDYSIVVNPLIVERASELFSLESRRAAAEKLLSYFDRKLPHDTHDASAWDLCYQLVPHVLSATSAMATVDYGSEWQRIRSTLLHRVGRYVLARGDSKSALAFFGEAISTLDALRDRIADPRAREYLLTLVSDLAVAHAQEGEWATAVDLATDVFRSHATYGSKLEKLHQLVYVNNLAASLADAGRISESAVVCANLYQRHRLVPDHSPGMAEVVLAVHHNWASMLAEMGDFKAALDVYERVLARKKLIFGRSTPVLVDTMVGMANVLARLKDNESAFNVATQAYGLAEDAYGEYHRLTLAALEQLAEIAVNLHDDELAQIIVDRVYRRRLDALGSGHPMTIDAMHKLALVKYRAGDHAAALKLIKTAVRLHERVHGAKHPRTVGARRDLVMVDGAADAVQILRERQDGDVEQVEPPIVDRRRRLFDEGIGLSAGVV